ncbi:unnamed protein product [Lepidochelys olivacea]
MLLSKFIFNRHINKTLWVSKQPDQGAEPQDQLGKRTGLLLNSTKLLGSDPGKAVTYPDVPGTAKGKAGVTAMAPLREAVHAQTRTPGLSDQWTSTSISPTQVQLIATREQRCIQPCKPYNPDAELQPAGFPCKDKLPLVSNHMKRLKAMPESDDWNWSPEQTWIRSHLTH